MARTDRIAIAEAFGERHDVGRNAFGLVREPMPGAAHAALDLVQHQQPAVLVAELAQALEVAGIGAVDTAFALYRLNEYSGDVLAFRSGSAYRLEVVVWHAVEAFHQGLESCLNFFVAGGAQRRQCAPVEAAFRDQYNRLLDAALVAMQTCELDGGLIGFGAGVTEEHAVHAGDGGELVAQSFLGWNAVQVGAVHDGAGLFGNGARHFGMGVPEPDHGDAAERVEILPTFGIPDASTFTARERDG